MLDLHTCRELLQLYEQMAAAATANDWASLASLEQQASARREAARPASAEPLSPTAAAELRALIERILALDAEVRAHAEPYHASTRKLLANSIRGRTVHDAYSKV